MSRRMFWVSGELSIPSKINAFYVVRTREAHLAFDYFRRFENFVVYLDFSLV